jgi:hypothetical protein
MAHSSTVSQEREVKNDWIIAGLMLTGMVSARAQTDAVFVLEQSVLTYHMSHPVHEVDGVSRGAKGKGVCHADACDFLLAAPVKSFDSGDTNRDLHMLQVTRGAEFPIVIVKLRIPLAAITMKDFECELDVQFAGNTAHYSHVPFHQEINGAQHKITGVVPATLTDFKIPAPSFLTVPIKNEIPVKVDAMWKQQ